MKKYILPFRMTQNTSQRLCSGQGDCLTQTDDVYTYAKNSDVLCEHNCQPVKCPNSVVCGGIGPKWFFGCYGGLCSTCNLRFGKTLTFPEKTQECPICMDDKPCVIQPKCSHPVCTDCFKRMRLDGPPRIGQPAFPYPEREDEYFDYFDEHGGKHSLHSDPLVVKYHNDYEWWELEQDRKWLEEENLRKCPLCRA